ASVLMCGAVREFGVGAATPSQLAAAALRRSRFCICAIYIAPFQGVEFLGYLVPCAPQVTPCSPLWTYLYLMLTHSTLSGPFGNAEAASSMLELRQTPPTEAS